jgi:hypothetical protein
VPATRHPSAVTVGPVDRRVVLVALRLLVVVLVVVGTAPVVTATTAARTDAVTTAARTDAVTTAGAAGQATTPRETGQATTGRNRMAAMAAVGPGLGSGNDTDGRRARIVAVYPDPLADGDAGEFVVVAAPRATTLTLADGESAIEFDHGGGVVALAAEPTAARALTDHPVVPAPALALANGGERLTLSAGGRVVDTVVYRRAPVGERLVRDDDGRRWLPLGYEPRPVVERGAAQATAFVLPDAPDVALGTLRAADDRILLAGYTLTSARVVRALVAAEARGVRVRVLVDDAPVGGLTTREARLLDRLARAGVEVRVLGGEGARFSYHHP